MKRVLQIMGGLNRGGLETFIMNIYRELDRNDIQFDFLVNSSGGDYQEEIERMGGRVYVLPPRNKGILNYKKALDNFFKQYANTYIACHAHISSLSSVSALEYACKYGIPVRVMHSHSSSISKSVRFNLLHKLLHYLNKRKVKRIANVYLGCSDKALDWLYNYTGVRSDASIINNGINVSKYVFSPIKREKIRKEFAIPLTNIVIGHVGRFIPLKNQKYLIDVLKEMISLGVNSTLMLVGDGDMRLEIEKYAKEQKLFDKVIFTGVRSDVADLMQAMDIFAMPSWFEGLPVSLVEAQASGLYVVASDTISRDSKLCDDFVFLSIQEPAKVWANTIINAVEDRKRPNNEQLIISKRFDSHRIAIDLVTKYKGLTNER